MRYGILVLALAGCGGSKDSTTDTGGPTGTTPPPGDDDDDATTGALTQSEFNAAYADKYCDEWATCNTSSDCPSTTTTCTASGTTCDFDPVAAQACLDGVWTCNTTYPGFEYPVGPAACSTVCG